MACHQCGKPAVYRIQTDNGSIDLCVECNLKFEQAESLEFQRDMQLLNVVGKVIGITTGLQLPGIPVLPSQTLPTNNMTLNNIRMQNSTIGVLNTGYIKSVDHAVTVLHQSGATDVANALKQLAQVVVDSKEIADEQRKQIIETLAAIADEAERPRNQRQPAVARVLVHDLGSLFGGLAGLSELWQTYGPVIRSFFGM